MTSMAQTTSMVEAVHAQTMEAIVQHQYGGAETLSVGALEVPAPGPGEVVIETRAAGLDRGTWHLMTGRPYLVRLVMGFNGPKNPVPGRDVAGVVRSVGVGVTRFKVGDEVFGVGEGSFAKFTRALADKLVHKPAGLTFAQAAVLGISGLTALQSLDAAKLVAGERVLIVGASGGVGTYAVQLAAARGAHVTAICSEAKAAMVRSLGAAEVLDYAKAPFPADGAFDVILDVGGNRSLATLRRALTPTGRLLFVGGELGGDWTAGFERQLWALLVQPFVRQRFVPFMAKEAHADLSRLVEAIERGALKPVIDREVPLAGVPAAMRALEAGEIRGKVAVVVG